MSTGNSSTNLEAFLKARLHQEVCGEALPEPRFSMTVSREAGTRSVPVCELVAQTMSERVGEPWMVHDKDLVALVIAENHLEGYVAKYLEEDKPDRVADYLAEMLDTHPTDWTLFHHTVDTVRRLARLGNAIIIGRGGNYVTSDLRNCFRIRLVGSDSMRLEEVEASQGLGEKDALHHLRRVDQSRSDYVESHLHRDIADPLAYHAVINTDRLSDEALARMICGLFLSWQGAKRSGARKPVAIA